MAKVYKIKLRNHDKYRARKDIQTPWWCRVKIRMFEDAEIKAMSAEMFRAWIFIITEQGREGKEEFFISTNGLPPMISERSLSDVIKLMRQMKVVLSKESDDIILGEHDTDAACTQSVQDPGTREEEKREETTLVQINSAAKVASKKELAPQKKIVRTNVRTDWLKLVYKKIYPRKEKCGDGIKILVKQSFRQSDADFFKFLKSFIKANRRYAEVCKSDRREKIKVFSTFCNEWEEWLEEDTGKVKFRKQKAKPQPKLFLADVHIGEEPTEEQRRIIKAKFGKSKSEIPPEVS